MIASGGDQEDVPESPGQGCFWLGVVVEASKGFLVDIKIGGPVFPFEMSLAGARVAGQAVSGVEAA